MSMTPDRSHRLRKFVRQLPFVGSTHETPESHLETNLVLGTLKDDQPDLYGSIARQATATFEDVKHELDHDMAGDYHMNINELTGLIARATRAGAAVVLAAIGKTSGEISELEQMTSLRSPQSDDSSA